MSADNKPCDDFFEDWAVCDDTGEPKGQCLNCGYKWFEHSRDALRTHKAKEAAIMPWKTDDE